MTEENKLEGLRGWLILVGLTIILSPLRIIAFIFQVYSELFSNGTWEALTTRGTEVYNQFWFWAPILMALIVINGGLLIVWLFIAYLFVSKKKVFPKWYIGVLVFYLPFNLISALSMKAVLPNEPIFDPDTIKELASSLLGILIWVPYMLVSKRVKATFVK